ncbi:hypothetical protein PHMEG_00032943 [Phytophthora megakarya]|uniref:Uncharacterized protein n=1 Tax=Phytophthora megakarya TaxID=4795 RepID=A0A225UVE4_9STRA|nr:hypothetical protein PHMEG_00032943 [Phytophthora megakarya]
MEKIIKVKKIMLYIAFTLDWVEAVTLNENGLQVVARSICRRALAFEGKVIM